jgi:hypothetical protein
LTAHLPKTAVVTWALLIVLTVASTLIGWHHGRSGAQAVGCAVLAIGFVKADIIARYFMEISHTPARFRLLVEGVIAICCIALIAILVAA